MVVKLHFGTTQSFHEIYSNSNRWDKEATLYQSFGEDRSSFGFLTYREAKIRKDVLSPLFSKRAISELQGVVGKNIDRLCQSLKRENAKGKSCDMLFAYRCFSLDTIVSYCFAQDVHATEAKDFKAPLTIAMDASLPAMVLFRHFELLRKMVFGMPGWLTKLTSPDLAGLVDLHAMVRKQINEVVEDKSALQKTSHPTIYNRLLDPELNKTAGVPPVGSLFEEALALFFGGAESAGTTSMVGTYHLLSNPPILARLKSELESLWPDSQLDTIPRLEDLERLPYLTAIIKESLRMSPSVPSPLPRVVSPTGATILDHEVPGGTVVAQSLIFVHMDPEIFPNPKKFDPERWLQPNSAALEKHLVAFSKGPRMCLGQTLAMCELYLAFAAVFRRFELEMDGVTENVLQWRECFLPKFTAEHLRAYCRPVKAGAA